MAASTAESDGHSGGCEAPHELILDSGSPSRRIPWPVLHRGADQDRCRRCHRASTGLAILLTTLSGTPTAAVLVVDVLACEPDVVDMVTFTFTA